MISSLFRQKPDIVVVKEDNKRELFVEVIDLQRLSCKHPIRTVENDKLRVNPIGWITYIKFYLPKEQFGNRQVSQSMHKPP